MASGKSVFDLDSDETQETNCFRVKLGTEEETVKIKSGMSVRDAFIMKAEALGFDFEKNLTFRDEETGVSIDGDESPVPGATYLAVTDHDEKG